MIIGGGVGPMAGVLLHQAIIRNTPNVTRDSDHVDVWHVSAVSGLPDRTSFLVGDELRNPAEQMAENIRAVGEVLSRRGQKWWVAVPCATFHSPPIFDVFNENIRLANGYCGTVNLVGETIKHLLGYPGKLRKVGVLSTKGSYDSGVWRRPLGAAGLESVELTNAEADLVHQAIYHPGYGLKAVQPPSSTAIEMLTKITSTLRQRNADVVVLGCTELPFVFRFLETAFGEEGAVINPIDIQARSIAFELTGGSSGVQSQ